MTCGQADDGSRAGPSPHEIAADVVATARNPCRRLQGRAAVFSVDASPLAAASRSAANWGQSSGSRSGVNVAMQQIPVAERAGRVRVRRRDRRPARRGDQPRHPLGDGLAVTGERTAAGAGALAQRDELREDLVSRRDGFAILASALVVYSTASTMPSSIIARTRPGNRLA